MANLNGSDFTVDGEEWGMWIPTPMVTVDGVWIAVKSLDSADEGEE